jgi:hypothetical protein
MGQRAAPAQKLDADYRYQISVVSGANGGFTVFTLDHETKKVYSRSIDATGSGGVEVKWLIAP